MDECAGVLALQCCLGTSCTPGTTKSSRSHQGYVGIVPHRGFFHTLMHQGLANVKLGKYHTISADDKASASVHTSRYQSIAKAK